VVGSKTTCQHNSGCVLDDPGTAFNDILTYKPLAFSRWSDPTTNVAPFDSNAQTAWPWLTELAGTGPFMLYDAPEVAGYIWDVDLVPFDNRSQGYSAGPPAKLYEANTAPNYHYYNSIDDIADKKAEMFAKVGDVNDDGKIDILDLVFIAKLIGKKETDPDWLPDCPKANLVPDTPVNKIDVKDLIEASKHYGWLKETPYVP
jgi:hypothetical protein